MNWEMIGASGEIVGATAVVVSLIYLARQIRTQVRQAMATRWDSVVDQISDFGASVGDHSEVADIFVRGLEGYDDLDDVERMRFHATLFRLFRSFEKAHHYSLQGDVPSWGATSADRMLRDYMEYSGFRKYWMARKNWYTENFRDHVDALVEVALREGPPAESEPKTQSPTSANAEQS